MRGTDVAKFSVEKHMSNPSAVKWSVMLDYDGVAKGSGKPGKPIAMDHWVIDLLLPGVVTLLVIFCLSQMQGVAIETDEDAMTASSQTAKVISWFAM
ncbi:MAG: hypothetical protein KTR14_09155 [Vampirovibrio sp.]|nr:hypothetical protein [Vampirovibrio sp.]